MTRDRRCWKGMEGCTLNVPCLSLCIYHATSSVSLKVVTTLFVPSRSHVLQLLLGGDLAVVLDVDVLVGGQSVDLVFGERGTVFVSLRSIDDQVSTWEWTYVKPLTSLNSCSILPPWSVTCFLALWVVSLVASCKFTTSKLTTPAGQRWHHP